MYNLKNYVMESMEIDIKRLNKYKKISNEIRLTGRLIRRPTKNKKAYLYYYKLPGKPEQYLGRKRYKMVRDLQRKKFADEMIGILTNNIEAKSLFCDSYIDDSAASVLDGIPKTYHTTRQLINSQEEEDKVFPQSENPFNREGLKIKTSFGLYVRSKSELQIAEFLYSLGVEFYYEKKLVLVTSKTVEQDIDGEILEREYCDTKIFYPDFTILLPNGKEIFWEHKGMLYKESYSQRDIEKEMIYNENGIYQPHNYVVTAEGPENSFDMEGISRLVKGWLMPMYVL